MAGGLGTRIRHLLNSKPKPMYEVHGRAFVEWVCLYLKEMGFDEVILSVGYRAEVIEEHFAGQPVPGVRVTCFSEAEPMGTAGGFWNAARQSELEPEAWLVLNGDSLLLADLEAMAGDFLASDFSAGMLALEVPDTSRYGSLSLGNDGRLIGYSEKKPGKGLINGGVYFLRHRLAHYFEQPTPLSFETDIFPSLVSADEAVKAYPCDAPFIDIGTEQTLPETAAFIQENIQHFCIS